MQFNAVNAGQRKSTQVNEGHAGQGRLTQVNAGRRMSTQVNTGHRQKQRDERVSTEVARN